MSLRFAALPLLLLCAAAHADDTRLQLATGAQYSDGEYGETTHTRALVMPLFARVSTGAWSFQLSVPYVNVRGPAALGEVLDDDGLDSHGGSSNSGSGSSGGGGDDGGGDDDPSTPPADPAKRDVSGIGDTSLSVAYQFSELGGTPFYLETRARVRLPTGSRRDGLGTGATDTIVSSELGFERPRGGAYLSGGRRFLGQAGDVERVDGWQLGAGAWWNVNAHAELGVNYDWRDASVRGGDAPRFAEGWFAWRFDDVWRIEINAGTGLSNASADLAAGFMLSWRAPLRGRRN